MCDEYLTMPLHPPKLVRQVGYYKTHTLRVRKQIHSNTEGQTKQPEDQKRT